MYIGFLSPEQQVLCLFPHLDALTGTKDSTQSTDSKMHIVSRLKGFEASQYTLSAAIIFLSGL